MALKGQGKLQLGQALGNIATLRKRQFDLSTLQSAADVINTRLEQSQKQYGKKKKGRQLGGLIGSTGATALGLGVGLATGGIGTLGLMGIGAVSSLAGGEIGRSLGMGMDTGDIEVRDDYMALLRKEDPDLARRVENIAYGEALKTQQGEYDQAKESSKMQEASLGTSLTGGKEGSYGSGLFASGHTDQVRYETFLDAASGAASGLYAGRLASSPKSADNIKKFGKVSKTYKQGDKLPAWIDSFSGPSHTVSYQSKHPVLENIAYLYGGKASPWGQQQVVQQGQKKVPWWQQMLLPQEYDVNTVGTGF